MTTHPLQDIVLVLFFVCRYVHIHVHFEYISNILICALSLVSLWRSGVAKGTNDMPLIRLHPLMSCHCRDWAGVVGGDGPSCNPRGGHRAEHHYWLKGFSDRAKKKIKKQTQCFLNLCKIKRQSRDSADVEPRQKETAAKRRTQQELPMAAVKEQIIHDRQRYFKLAPAILSEWTSQTDTAERFAPNTNKTQDNGIIISVRQRASGNQRES